MNSAPLPCSADLADIAASLGISAIGIAAADVVDRQVAATYRAWIAAGRHASMSYLDRYHDVRVDPTMLLDGVRSVIVAAFNYYPATKQSGDVPQFSYYAYGRDYHEVVRERLGTLARHVEDRWGGLTRVCVDTAPIHERYWARKAGVGFIGRNAQLIIPGQGSYFFLGEVLTTVSFSPDNECTLACDGCGACVKACPGGAICGDSTIDARRCLSYLTIEHRGDLPAGTRLGNHVYGCDVCQQVCPHNREAVATGITEFAPSPAFLALDEGAITNLTPERFREIFRHSAVKRAKLSGLQRNMQCIKARR